MKPTNFLAIKYLFSKTRFNIVSIISLFSVFVLSVSYFAFTIILSVLSGLESYSLQFTKSFDPEIKITKYDEGLINLNQQDVVFLAEMDDTISKILRTKVLVENNGEINYAEIIGVDKNFNKVVDFSKLVNVGEYSELNDYNSYTSYSLTDKLNLNLFNISGAFNIYFLNTQYPDLLFRPYKNSKILFSDGVFTTRNDDQENIIIADVSVVQELMGLESNVYSDLYFSNFRKNKKLKEKLKEYFTDYKVQSRDEINETLFKMIQSEKLVVILIMIMIILISSFNVISTVIMLIIEKEKDIQTLRILGLKKSSIQNVFFQNGILINTIGLSLGLVVGTIIILVQKNTGFISVGEMGLAYPVEIKAINYFIILLTASIVAVVSSFISSGAVKKLS
ncbi:MAG: FtsX-like permease family protein [Bacteroidota bacterium]|nr:FtsX-like permease family protein [Bacteroidota bacterium]